MTLSRAVSTRCGFVCALAPSPQLYDMYVEAMNIHVPKRVHAMLRLHVAQKVKNPCHGSRHTCVALANPANDKHVSVKNTMQCASNTHGSSLAVCKNQQNS
eukprot:scpid104463/ scgid17027/ 